jgi:hypothetical protein
MTENARIFTPDRPVSPRQEVACISLASGSSIEAAAVACGVSSRTVKGWLATVPAFKKRIGALRDEMTSQALGKLLGSLTDAVTTLADLHKNAASETARIMAASRVVEFGLRMREHTELAQRVSDLEQAMSHRSRRHSG